MRRLAVATFLALALAAPAQAQTSHTIGSTLQQTANYSSTNYIGNVTGGNECLARPYIGVDGQTFINTQQTTCMWWNAPLTAAASYVPLGQGTITSASVRSGPSPAPLRITVLSSGGGLCCTAQARSDVFQPNANAVTTVPLNLPASAGLDPNRSGSQFNDFVAVTAVGPGSLPVHDYGQHGTFNTTIPAASFLHPELVPNNSNTDVGWMDGYEVLLQVTWCGTTGVGRVHAAQACGAAAGGGGGGGTGGGATGGGATGGGGTTGGGTGGGGTGGGTAGGATDRLTLSGFKFSNRKLSIQLSGPGSVKAVLATCKKKKCKTKKTLKATAKQAGTVKLTVPKSVKKGTYRATITATSAAGIKSTLVKNVKVK